MRCEYHAAQKYAIFSIWNIQTHTRTNLPACSILLVLVCSAPLRSGWVSKLLMLNETNYTHIVAIFLRAAPRDHFLSANSKCLRMISKKRSWSAIRYRLSFSPPRIRTVADLHFQTLPGGLPVLRRSAVSSLAKFGINPLPTRPSVAPANSSPFPLVWRKLLFRAKKYIIRLERTRCAPKRRTLRTFAIRNPSPHPLDYSESRDEGAEKKILVPGLLRCLWSNPSD